jgi:hypothetical protein
MHSDGSRPTVTRSMGILSSICATKILNLVATLLLTGCVEIPEEDLRTQFKSTESLLTTGVAAWPDRAENRAEYIDATSNRLLRFVLSPLELTQSLGLPAGDGWRVWVSSANGSWHIVTLRNQWAIVRPDASPILNPLTFAGTIQSMVVEPTEQLLVIRDSQGQMGVVQMDSQGTLSSTLLATTALNSDTTVDTMTMLAGGVLLVGTSSGDFAKIDLKRSLASGAWIWESFIVTDSGSATSLASIPGNSNLILMRNKTSAFHVVDIESKQIVSTRDIEDKNIRSSWLDVVPHVLTGTAPEESESGRLTVFWVDDTGQLTEKEFVSPAGRIMKSRLSEDKRTLTLVSTEDETKVTLTKVDLNDDSGSKSESVDRTHQIYPRTNGWLTQYDSALGLVEYTTTDSQHERLEGFNLKWLRERYR